MLIMIGDVEKKVLAQSICVGSWFSPFLCDAFPQRAAGSS